MFHASVSFLEGYLHTRDETSFLGFHFRIPSPQIGVAVQIQAFRVTFIFSPMHFSEDKSEFGFQVEAERVFIQGGFPKETSNECVFCESTVFGVASTNVAKGVK